MALVRSDARTASRQIRKTTGRPETSQGKRRPGRPSKYKPEFAERVTDYCLLGATNEELSAHLQGSRHDNPRVDTALPGVFRGHKKGA